MTQHDHSFRVRFVPKTRGRHAAFMRRDTADLGWRGGRRVIPAVTWNTVVRRAKPGVRNEAGNQVVSH